jgi:hypothetical protein
MRNAALPAHRLDRPAYGCSAAPPPVNRSEPVPDARIAGATRVVSCVAAIKLTLNRALGLRQVELVSRTLLQRERVVHERRGIAAGPRANLRNCVSCGRSVRKINDEGRSGDASSGDLGMPLRQPRGVAGQERDCEPLGSERAGDRGSNARANTRDDDNWLHSIRLRGRRDDMIAQTREARRGSFGHDRILLLSPA